jgi:hypothetical protein
MSFLRVAGLGGLLFAIPVTVVNTFLVAPRKPIGDPPLSVIVSYYVEHGDAVRLLSIIAPIAWAALSLFTAGVLLSTRGTDGRTNGWALVGLAGIAMMVPSFCGVVTADSVLATRASTLAERPEFTQMLWDFHMILQILNWAFVAIALCGFGMAAVVSGAAPRLGRLAVPGAVLLLAGSTQSLAGLGGSSSVFIGLPGFVIWLVFVLGYSLVMIRSRSTATA